MSLQKMGERTEWDIERMWGDISEETMVQKFQSQKPIMSVQAIMSPETCFHKTESCSVSSGQKLHWCANVGNTLIS